MSAKKSPKSEAAALRKEIREHDRRYYELEAPTIADAEYDALVARLKALEKAHPQLRSPDSPTEKVSGAPASTFAPVKHARPMLSLDNTYNEEEIRTIILRAKQHKIDTIILCGPRVREKKIVTRIQSEGIKVGAWGVGSNVGIGKTLIASGIDRFTIDNPEELFQNL